MDTYEKMRAISLMSWVIQFRIGSEPRTDEDRALGRTPQWYWFAEVVHNGMRNDYGEQSPELMSMPLSEIQVTLVDGAYTILSAMNPRDGE